MTTTRAINPQQAALERVILLQNKLTIAHSRASSLMELALNDAAKLPHVDTDYVPVVLSESALVEFARLKNELSGLVEFYQRQAEHLSINMLSAPSAGPESDEIKTAVGRMRERINSLASDSASPAPGETIVTIPKAELRRPTATAAREAAAAIREERLAQEAQASEGTAITGGVTYTLPPPQSLVDPALTLNGEEKVEDDVIAKVLPEVIKQNRENNLAVLMGPDSPLLQLFAAGPWLPEGKGFVTVGSEGFQWYKRTHPTDKPSGVRATLPTGFYAGEARPECVLLRLKNAIILWPFDMNPEETFAYIAGLSDANPQEVTWFPLSQLSSSYTRRLVDEIKELLPERPAV